MPFWNSGATWSSGQLWGPSTPVTPSFENTKQKTTKMQRQAFYPRPLGERAEWHTNFATKLPVYASALTLTQAEEDNAVADNLMMAYALGGWIVTVREHATSCTASLDTLGYGTGSVNYAFPAEQLPPLPTLPGSLTGVKPGALQRTFDLVAVLKRSPGYTEAIGQDLGIVGEADTTVYTRPDFTLKVEGLGSGGCNCVKVRHKRYGHYAVAVYSRRGTGDWELLHISAESPYLDERALLVAGQPEIREYKMRFWDAGSENGEWSDVASVTVSL
jgi:hypothetical protein